MLPDFPEIKGKLLDLFLFGIKYILHQNAPMVALTPKHIIHEGNKTILIREETEIVDIPIKKFSSELKFDIKELESLSLKSVFERFQKMALDFATDQEKYLIETLNKELEKVGNVINNKGQPLDPDLFLKLIEKIQLDFNPDGTPKFPFIFASEKLMNKLKEIFKLLSKEPYKSKFEGILEKKRLEYHVRESNRKLVD